MNPTPQSLREELHAAILGYNMNRVKLVQDAQRDGGSAAVARLEDEFSALCKADLALATAQLNESHRQYEALMSEAVACGAQLKRAIIGLETFTTVLDAMAQTVTIIGRVLLMLAV